MEPRTEWTHEAYKAWLARLEESHVAVRKDRLKVIASGPCNREDVQAARRLLCKPRYATDD